jgi:hypothetical protein
MAVHNINMFIDGLNKPEVNSNMQERAGVHWPSGFAAGLIKP